MITLTLQQYVIYAGNLLKCMWQRATIMQGKLKSFEGISQIALSQASEKMQELIDDSLTLEMETCMDYEDGFPHETYWLEINIYIEKYKIQPWQLYNQMKNNVGNGNYAAFFRWYAQGVEAEIKTLETWAQEVRI